MSGAGARYMDPTKLIGRTIIKVERQRELFTGPEWGNVIAFSGELVLILDDGTCVGIEARSDKGDVGLAVIDRTKKPKHARNAKGSKP